MLVLTRRSKDKIVFPQLGVSIQFIRVQSGHVKVGVEAPRDITILRDELLAGDEAVRVSQERQLGLLPHDVRHGIRNELHQVSVGMHLFKELVSAGLQDEADDVFAQIQEALGRLDQADALCASPSKPDGPHTCRVLLVEDQPNEREMLASILRLRDVDVATRANGTEAIDYFRFNDPPTHMLIDMQMPECDGATTLQTLQSEQLLRQTKVFVLSGNPPESYGVAIGEQNVERWFPKPLDPSVLVHALTFSVN
ncbi:MAG: response regulator [Planctomycetota bacterium]